MSRFLILMLVVLCGFQVIAWADNHKSRTGPIILTSPVDSDGGPCFSPNGKYVANSGEVKESEDRRRGVITVWNLHTRKVLHILKSESIMIYSLAFSPDSRILAAGCHDENVYMWNVETGKSLGSLAGPSGGNRIFELTFSKDGNRLYGVCYHGMIPVWDVRTMKLEFIFGDYYRGSSVAVSPDAKLVAGAINFLVCDPDRPETSKREMTSGDVVKIWSASSHKLLATLEGPLGKYEQESIHAVDFSPSGRYLLVGSNRGVRLWEVNKQRIARTLFRERKTESGSVDAAYTPDGRSIFATSDGILRIWDATTGQLQRRKQLPKGVHFIVLSPNGRSYAYGVSATKKHKSGVAVRSLE